MTLHTLYTNMTFFKNTLRIHGRILGHILVTTDDFITNTGHCRRLYIRLTQLCVGPRNTLKNTWSCTMTGTGHDRRLYNQYRSLPTTLYTFYTIMCESSEYTENTRLCTMTGTGHDRRLYNQYRSLPTTLYTFYTIMCESSEYTVVYYDINRSRPMAL